MWRRSHAATCLLMCAFGGVLAGLAGCGADPAKQALLPAVARAGASSPIGGRSVLAQGRAASSSDPFRFFVSTSFWNGSLAANAAVDPNSAQLVGQLDAEVAAEERAGNGPWINTSSYSVPIYTVPASQPLIKVRLLYHRPEPALEAAWEAVPLPPSAQPAQGSDGELVVWQPSTERMWEFWRLVHGTKGWYASWGGAIQDVSSDPGVYRPKAWPGAKTWWGASASSLSIAGGLITLEDLEQGTINHALAIAVPEVRAGEFAYPAQRSDGTSANPFSLPEGARLRLNPAVNLAQLHLPRLTLMIAQAARRYGIFVRDKGANVQFFAQDPIPTGTDPFTGAGGYFEAKSPSELLASFPWSDLEVLQLKLNKTKARS
ncbi:MAG: hypothetical protein ABSG93_18465 [Solirubrobacteraceae bacterium]